MAETDFTNPKYYNNRELSWILFNHRVLSEARDKTNPLFERLKFLSITASNLDEFFMVRVASLRDMVNAGYSKKDIAGMTAQEQLEKIDEAIHELVNLQYSPYLTPHPHRGERNEPYFIPLIMAKLANVLNMSEDEVIATSTNNAENLFRELKEYKCDL